MTIQDILDAPEVYVVQRRHWDVVDIVFIKNISTITDDYHFGLRINDIYGKIFFTYSEAVEYRNIRKEEIEKDRKESEAHRLKLLEPEVIVTTEHVYDKMWGLANKKSLWSRIINLFRRAT